jgi:hypothetical protein
VVFEARIFSTFQLVVSMRLGFLKILFFLNHPLPSLEG